MGKKFWQALMHRNLAEYPIFKVQAASPFNKYLEFVSRIGRDKQAVQKLAICH